MFRLSFQVDGALQLERFLDILADDVDNFKDAFKEMADDFRETEENIFNSSGAFEGNSAWAPLKPGYASLKALKVGNKPILTYKGDLRKSLSTRGSGHVERITKDTLEIGTRDKKAIFHQRGTRKMAQRKVVDLTDPQKRRWVRIAHTEIFRQLNGGV
jgi:phage gpG-like protein